MMKIKNLVFLFVIFLSFPSFGKIKTQDYDLYIQNLDKLDQIYSHIFKVLDVIKDRKANESGKESFTILQNSEKRRTPFLKLAYFAKTQILKSKKEKKINFKCQKVVIKKISEQSWSFIDQCLKGNNHEWARLEFNNQFLKVILHPSQLTEFLGLPVALINEPQVCRVNLTSNIKIDQFDCTHVVFSVTENTLYKISNIKYQSSGEPQLSLKGEILDQYFVARKFEIEIPQNGKIQWREKELTPLLGPQVEVLPTLAPTSTPNLKSNLTPPTPSMMLPPPPPTSTGPMEPAEAPAPIFTPSSRGAPGEAAEGISEEQSPEGLDPID